MFPRHLSILVTTIILQISCINYNLAQSPSIAWQKSIGGSNWDQANEFAITPDGGLLVAGYSSSSDGDVTGNHGFSDYWITKLNGEGELIWQKCFGGSGYDYCEAIVVSPDGGFVLAGGSNSIDGDKSEQFGSFDFWVIKINDSGEILWEKSFGGSEWDMAYGVISIDDSYFFIVGSSQSSDGLVTGHHGGTTSDIWVVKIDLDGNYIWGESFGSNGSEYGRSIAKDQINNFVIAGSSDNSGGDVSWNFGFTDYWILEMNQEGELIGEKSFGGSNDDIPYDITSTAFNSGFIIAGETYSNDFLVTDFIGLKDSWLIAIDSGIDTSWKRCYGGGDGDASRSLITTSDSGFISVGNSRSTDGDLLSNNGVNDFWVFECDSSGTLIWQTNIGGSDEDMCNDVAENVDGSLFLAGYSKSNDYDLTENKGDFDFWIVKLAFCNTHWFADSDNDSFGDLLDDSISCLPPFGYVTDSTDCNDLNPNIYPGALEILNGLDDDCDGQSDEGLSIINDQVIHVSIHPIPATDHIIIDYPTSTPTTLNIYTSSGAIIYQNPRWTGEAIDISNFPPAMYYLQLFQVEKVGYGCFVKE